MRRVLRRLFTLLAGISIVLLLAGNLLPAAAEPAGAEKRAFVTVAGAPGDGEKALAAAVSRRLAKAGIKEATAFEASIYEIQGTVRVTPASGNKDKVRIVWVVFSPDGRQLGVVSQARFIRKGSLDRTWGGAADAAAQGAVAEIVKLLPRAE